MKQSTKCHWKINDYTAGVSNRFNQEMLPIDWLKQFQILNVVVEINTYCQTSRF